MTDYKDPFITNDSRFGEQPVGNFADKPQVEYASFWDRVGALLLDSLIIGIPIGGLNIWNMYEERNFMLYIVLSLLGLAYKPVLEGAYGATLGKMIVNLKITSKNGDPISTGAAWLRSIFIIVQALVQIPFYYLAFHNEDLLELEGMAFSGSVAVEYPLINIISVVYFVILIVEIVMLVTDTVFKQSLHDRIADTVVIKK